MRQNTAGFGAGIAAAGFQRRRHWALSTYARISAPQVKTSSTVIRVHSLVIRMMRPTTYAILGFLVAALLGSQYWQYQRAQQILLKIQLLDISLQVAAKRDSISAGMRVKGIAASVAKNRNQARDLYVLQLSKEIQSKTDSAVRLFPVMRKLLLSNKIYPDSLARPKQVNETAVQLQRNVKEYLAFIKPFDSDSLFGAPSELGLYNSRVASHPELAELLADASKKQALYGGNAALAVVLAMLTQQEFEIRLHELNALEKQAQKVGTTIDSYFKIGVFTTAESNSVAAGDTYKAQLFLSGSAAGIKTRMTVNGKPIDIGLDGRGQVELHVPANAAKDKPVRAYWEGTVRAAFNYRDSIFRVRVPYTIRPKQH